MYFFSIHCIYYMHRLDRKKNPWIKNSSILDFVIQVSLGKEKHRTNIVKESMNPKVFLKSFLIIQKSLESILTNFCWTSF